MRARRLWLGLLGTLALAVLPAPAGAQPVGSEFQVNTYTTNIQFTGYGHSVAADASGNFVVVWDSLSQDGSGRGVFGQRYDSGGVAQGAEFRVNSYVSQNQDWPSVASDASGNFVVVWRSYGQDGSNFGVFGQRYDSAGGTLGSEFRVNTYTTTGQTQPSVASDASGNFVVVWQSQGDGSNLGVFGQRYDSGGVPQGDEFRVNSYTTSIQQNPSVASDASGNFVVVWMSTGDQDGSGTGIFGQRYDSEGAALGAEFRVNSYTTGYQSSPFVASDASGSVVVVWLSDQLGQLGDYDIFGQRYDSTGATMGSEFQVNSSTEGSQKESSVASDASGNFVVVWAGYSDDGQFGALGQRYDSAGVAQGDEFQINSYTTGAGRSPYAAATGTNQFVAAWSSYGQDGSSWGVFGQRFDFSGSQTITVVKPNTDVKWRIGSVKEIQWTHNLGVDATFRIELDRNGDGDYEEVIAAAAPASSATKGSFAWTVTGPPTPTARIRVSWTDDPSVSDASDTTFHIKPAH